MHVDTLVEHAYCTTGDTMTRKRRERRGWGAVRKLPSGRHQASYVGPDGLRYRGRNTFASRDDAIGWLNAERRRIDLEAWTPPTVEREAGAAPTLREYSEQWLLERTLSPNTRVLYADLLRLRILPTLGDIEMVRITAPLVRSWWAGLDATTPTRNSHAYGLLRGIFSTAVEDEIVNGNPCRIRGAGSTKRVKPIVILTPAELDTLANNMPERLILAVHLAGWLALRRGELFELRRKDISSDRTVIHVRRAVVFLNGQAVVSSTKSEASVRDITVPPHIVPLLDDHLKTYTGRARTALLFPGDDGAEHLTDYAYRKHFDRAADAIGRPELTPHQLRHFGAVLAARVGATIADLQARLGHTSARAALVYQSTEQSRDSEIAAKLSGFRAI